MPSLKLFGQPTPVASDDLRPYAISTLILRICQIGLTIVLAAQTGSITTLEETLRDWEGADVEDLIEKVLGNGTTIQDCLSEDDLMESTIKNSYTSYLILSTILAVAGVVIADAIWIVTGRGTPTDATLQKASDINNGQSSSSSSSNANNKPTKKTRTTTIQSLCHVHLTVLMLLRITVVILGCIVQKWVRLMCSCIDEAKDTYEDLWVEFVADENHTLWEDNTHYNDVDLAEVQANLEEWSKGCHGSYLTTFYILIITHICETILSGAVIVYLLLPELVSQLQKRFFLPRALDSENRWRIFCRCCCTLTSVMTCCLFGGPEASLGDFTEIAMLLSDFFDFHGTLDVTATDMIPAMMILGQMQTERHVEYHHQMKQAKRQNSNDNMDKNKDVEEKSQPPQEPQQDTAGTTKGEITYRLKRYQGADVIWEAYTLLPLSHTIAEDRLVIAEGARFMKLSMAIYTWMMYAVNHGFSGLCTICCTSLQRDCHSLTRKSTDEAGRYFAGEGHCCRLHSTALMVEAGLTSIQTILYASFKSALVATPYALVVDHEWKSVVIVVRGTLSLEDVLTDLTIRPADLTKVGEQCGFDGSAYLAHEGMLATAQLIKKELEQHCPLDKTMETYKGYRLRVCGHSLGAGVASILSLMLRPSFPTLRCHAFSPPGCTLSENAAQYCEGWMTSYVLDGDIIPRASLNSLDNLRHALVDVIARIKVSKSQVVDEFTGCRRHCGRGKNDEDSSSILDRVLYKEDETPNSDFLQKWRKYRQLYDQRKLERGVAQELYPAGKIVHLMPEAEEPDKIGDEGIARSLSSPLCCLAGSKPDPEYMSRWANRLDFREIRLSSHIVDDHMPQAVLSSLIAEAKSFGLEPPFTVPQESSITAADTGTVEVTFKDRTE